MTFYRNPSVIFISCDWPDCKRTLNTGTAHTRKAMQALSNEGWTTRVPDGSEVQHFCPEHSNG